MSAAERGWQHARIIELMADLGVGDSPESSAAVKANYLLDNGVTVEVPAPPTPGATDWAHLPGCAGYFDTKTERVVCTCPQPGDVAIATVHPFKAPHALADLCVTCGSLRTHDIHGQPTPTSRAAIVTEADRDELIAKLQAAHGAGCFCHDYVREWFAVRLGGGR